MIVKCLGCEIELCLKFFYASVPRFGGLFIEFGAVVRGNWWADYIIDEGTLELFLGKTYIVLCRPGECAY